MIELIVKNSKGRFTREKIITDIICKKYENEDFPNISKAKLQNDIFTAYSQHYEK